MDQRYHRLLSWAVEHPWKIVATATVVFLASMSTLSFIGTEFVPESDQGFISIRLNTPVGSSLEYTDSKVQQVEAALRRMAVKVDAQNAGDAAYKSLVANPNGAAFQAALDLVFKGKEQPSG